MYFEFYNICKVEVKISGHRTYVSSFPGRVPDWSNVWRKTGCYVWFVEDSEQSVDKVNNKVLII